MSEYTVTETGPCPECGGAGDHLGRWCKACHGSGKYEKQVPLDHAIGQLISRHPDAVKLLCRQCD